MSTAVFPSALARNVSYPAKRTTQFKTRKFESISGKETVVSDQTIPRYVWELPMQLLRQGSIAPFGPWTEQAVLQGFIEQMLGGYDTWLFADKYDSAVTAQPIQNTVTLLTNGDGATLTYQLQRTRGGFTMPILAPNAVATVYVNSSPVSASTYTVSGWGSSTPGLVTFGAGHAPGSGVPVTADFTYYFPVRFLMDAQDFDQFMSGLYEVKSLKFRSIK